MANLTAEASTAAGIRLGPVLLLLLSILLDSNIIGPLRSTQGARNVIQSFHSSRSIFDSYR